VMVSMFGRETPVELDALQVKQLWYNSEVTH
jgi:transcription antitermination factor NusG